VKWINRFGDDQKAFEEARGYLAETKQTALKNEK